MSTEGQQPAAALDLDELQRAISMLNRGRLDGPWDYREVIGFREWASVEHAEAIADLFNALRPLLALAREAAGLKEALRLAEWALNDCPFTDPLKRQNQHLDALGAARRVLYPPKASSASGGAP